MAARPRIGEGVTIGYRNGRYTRANGNSGRYESMRNKMRQGGVPFDADA
jgi:hypothetical protein